MIRITRGRDVERIGWQAVPDTKLRDELIGVSHYAWQRLIDRLDGLSDDEYATRPNAAATMRARTARGQRPTGRGAPHG